MILLLLGFRAQVEMATLAGSLKIRRQVPFVVDQSRNVASVEQLTIWSFEWDHSNEVTAPLCPESRNRIPAGEGVNWQMDSVPSEEAAQQIELFLLANLMLFTESLCWSKMWCIPEKEKFSQNAIDWATYSGIRSSQSRSWGARVFLGVRLVSDEATKSSYMKERKLLSLLLRICDTFKVFLLEEKTVSHKAIVRTSWRKQNVTVHSLVDTSWRECDTVTWCTAFGNCLVLSWTNLEIVDFSS